MTFTTVSLSILSVLALLGLVGSTGALVSGMWVLDWEFATRATTLYLPFYWNVTLRDQGSILNLAYWIIGVSFVSAVVSTFILVLSLAKVLRPRTREEGAVK